MVMVVGPSVAVLLCFFPFQSELLPQRIQRPTWTILRSAVLISLAFLIPSVVCYPTSEGAASCATLFAG